MPSRRRAAYTRRVTLAELNPRSIVVLRALQLGDLLCAVPALRALREAAPRARISLIGLPWAAELPRRLSRYLDEFIEFPGYPGLPERDACVERLPEFLASVQRRRFDLAIQMHGDGSYVNSIVLLMGAARAAGFCEPGGWCPDRDSFLEYPASGSEPERLLRLVEFLGAVRRGDGLEFPLTEDERSGWRTLAAEFGLQPRGYVCVHPGARWPSRRWPVERFATVADILAGRGLRVVLTGAEGERALTAAVAARMRTPAADLGGKTSLGVLAAAIAQARLLVCNDTGVSHVAAAVGTPSVVVASGSDVERWAPRDRTLHRVVSVDMDCRPCGFWECPIGHPCALGVTAAATAHAVQEALAP